MKLKTLRDVIILFLGLGSWMFCWSISLVCWVTQSHKNLPWVFFILGFIFIIISIVSMIEDDS